MMNAEARIAKLDKQITDLEEQASRREDTISFVRESLHSTEAGIVDLENALDNEKATSGRWFASHVAAAEEENEVIEKLEAENLELREALLIYGCHSSECQRECVCGYEAALGKEGGE